MSIALAQRIKELEALVAELCARVAELEKKRPLSLPKKDAQ